MLLLCSSFICRPITTKLGLMVSSGTKSLKNIKKFDEVITVMYDLIKLFLLSAEIKFGLLCLLSSLAETWYIGQF